MATPVSKSTNKRKMKWLEVIACVLIVIIGIFIYRNKVNSN